MNELTITIPGPPIAKKRPRFVRRGKFVGTYNPQETEEGRWLWDVSQQLNGMEKIEGPVEIIMGFSMPVPSSFSEKKKAAILAAPHTKKPDTDNLQKFVLDCLNGVLWKDDSQVYRIIAHKYYGVEPMTHLLVRW